MADEFDKRQVVVREVEVRPVRSDERRRWDALMAEHHYLGFRQFAGRGLRHVAVWRGHWLALVGWQSGAFKCAPRDRWLGWHRSVQFRRLHLIGNNTRFLILPAALGISNLGSRVLGCSLRRLSADWSALYGHPLELAETFVDPSRFHGGVYAASNWVRVGRTKGFARHNGSYTDPHEAPKEMFVRPLRRAARARLAHPDERPEWACRATPVRYTHAELRSLRDLFAGLPDCRRGQGRKHALATVLSVCALARLAGLSGPAATERFARQLDQAGLRALGAWRDPTAGRWVAPSDSTICRVLADTDPDALAGVLRQWAAPRLAPAGTPVLAADGKRIRGANRHADGAYFETVTLVTHGGRPLASRCCRDEGGESAALRALLDDVDLRGCVVTLDALHTTRDMERALIDIHRADYLLTVKGNCPETLAALTTLDWTGATVRHHAEAPEKGHGRIESRRIDVHPLPPRLLVFEAARQGCRITRERTCLKTGETRRETACGITSVTPDRATPQQLLNWNRGHWQVENGNHYRRDATLGEDASRHRARHAPANNATLNNLALAIVFHRGFRYLPEANLHFMMQRQEALDAILSPT